MPTNYSDKFIQFSQQSLYKNLDTETQLFLKTIAFQYQFSHQELRQLLEISTDFIMWREAPIQSVWQQIESTFEIKAELSHHVDFNDNLSTTVDKAELSSSSVQTKLIPLRDKAELSSSSARTKLVPLKDIDKSSRKKALHTLHKIHADLLHQANNYPTQDFLKAEHPRKKAHSNEEHHNIFGLCPVYSDKTACCNLYTIDVAQGCGFGCSYCSIQSFYQPEHVTIDKNLAEKLNNIPIDPTKHYHIGSGQASDSLLWGNRHGVLDAQIEFARNHSNIFLEFKTKSKNIGYFLNNDIPKNVVVSWSLNPDVIIHNEEHFTASLNDRLQSARALADKNIAIAFHFHPIVQYQGWQNDYRTVIEKLMSLFSANEISFISMGTLTFTKASMKKIKLNGIESKIMQMPMEDAAGKLSYPYSIKVELFSTIWQFFKPWKDKVFFYFCMEDQQLWKDVFGKSYPDNKTFEDALYQQVMKI